MYVHCQEAESKPMNRKGRKERKEGKRPFPFRFPLFRFCVLCALRGLFGFRPLPVALRTSDCGLCGCEARDRHAEWGAGNVIEPDRVAEGDGRRFTAMLAADTDL